MSINTANTTEPKWLTLARSELHTKEAPGDADNPKIVQYYADAGHPEVKHDATAWCSAALSSWLKRSGIKPSGSLMAKSYLTFGSALTAPQVGCIAVLWRGSPNASTGHVGLVTSWTPTEVSILGGNQGETGEVSIETFPRYRVLAWRWPAATVASPAKPLTLWGRIKGWLSGRKTPDVVLI